MKHPTPPQLLHALLALALACPPSSFAADAPSMATQTLTGLNGALGDMGTFMNAFGTSTAQLQAMSAQLAQAQQMAGGSAQQQSQFDQIRQQLSLAMTEANNCVMQATPANYDKYVAKRPAAQKDVAKNLTPDAITSVEPTCATYGVLLDAIAVNKAKMADTNKRMACITNLQNKVSQLAEQAKAPFQQLNNAASEVYKTYTSIADTHSQIANKIADDVDGPADKDGQRKGGYRAALGNLKQMSLELNNVLNAKQGENKEGLKMGLVKQVENLKQQRVSAANQWYFTLMGDVEYCYHSEPAPCFDNDYNLPPDQCLAAMVENNAQGTRSAGKGIRAKGDVAGLQRIGLKTYMNAQKINLPANIDVTKPDEFLSFTQVRFKETLLGVLGAYRAHNFTSGIDKGAMTDYVNKNYQACYDKSVEKFKADMISKGGQYYQAIQAMHDAERETANDLKNWLDRVEGEMSSFRTQFHKTYNTELAQFKSDCADDGDPYKGLDCLRVFNTQLQSGIRGTRNTAKLSNGTTYVANAGETALPIQTLTLDQKGKPTIGNATVTCSGFDDCINYLDGQRSQHSQAAQKAETDRKGFVEQHNAAVKQSFDMVAQQFSQMSTLMLAGIKGVNDDLAKLGIKAQVKTKQIEAEELKENEKTGLIDMPKSMKAAMAGRNAFTEIEDTQSVTDAFNTQLTELNKKAGDAQKQKRLCRIDASDYKRAAGIMPRECSSTKDVCTRDRLAQGSGVLDDILRRSKEKVEENASSQKLTSNADYRQCISEIKQDANTNLDDDDRLEEFAQTQNPPFSIWQNTTGSGKTIDPQARARARAALRSRNVSNTSKQVKNDCSSFILTALNSQAGDSRSTLREQNQGLIQALGDVSAACATVETNEKGEIVENEEVTSACSKFKDLANNAKGPTGEAETGEAGASKLNTDAPTNPFSGTAK